MEKIKKLTALLTAVLMLAAVLTGCDQGAKSSTEEQQSAGKENETAGTSGQPSSSQSDNTGLPLDPNQHFVWRDNSAVIGLNPMINTSSPDNGAHALIYETLVRKEPDQNGGVVIEPGVAESWSLSDDGTVYTFKIRDSAMWQDGVPVKAQDFEYTYRMMATPSVGSTNAWLFDGVIQNFSESLYNDGVNPEYNKNPEDIGVRAVDDTTVEFILTKPCGYFLDLITGAYPVRQDKYEEYKDSYGSSFDKTVMNGPYTIESWNQNVQMTFVKNDKYWDAANVKPDKVERKVIQETATAVQALMGGEIDACGVSDPDWRSMVEADGRFKSMEVMDNAPEFLAFNCSNKYFKNPKIRLAFSLAIDREKYVKDLRNGDAVALYSLMPDVMNCGNKPYHEMVKDENYVLKDMMAKHPDPQALLIEGLTEEGLDPDPAKMEVRYATRGTAEFSKKSAEWLLQEWREKLGVSITIDMMEWNIMWDKIDEGDYDIATSGWGPYYNDPNAFLSLYEPKNGYFNSPKSGWIGEDADEFASLLEQAADTVDEQQRADLLLKAEKILVGTAVIAPTYVDMARTYIPDYVQDYFMSSHATVDYRKVWTSGRPN